MPPVSGSGSSAVNSTLTRARTQPDSPGAIQKNKEIGVLAMPYLAVFDSSGGFTWGGAGRYSFDMGAEADLLDKAIANALAAGLRTPDIMQPGMRKVGTTEMGGAIVTELTKLMG